MLEKLNKILVLRKLLDQELKDIGPSCFINYFNPFFKAQPIVDGISWFQGKHDVSYVNLLLSTEVARRLCLRATRHGLYDNWELRETELNFSMTGLASLWEKIDFDILQAVFPVDKRTQITILRDGEIICI